MMARALPRLPKWALVLVYFAALLLAAFFFFTQIRGVLAAIEFDAVTLQDNQTCAPTCATFTHTITDSGADRALIVTTGGKPNGGVVTGITYDGNALTMVPGSAVSALKSTISIWYLLDPPVGSALDVIISTGGVKNHYAAVMSFRNINQTQTLSDLNTAGSGVFATTSVISQGNINDPVTIDVVTTEADTWIIEAAHYDKTLATMVAHTGRTVRLGAALKAGASTQEAATAATYTLDWTQGGCCRDSIQSAAAFRRAPVDFPVSGSSTATLGDSSNLIRGFNFPGSSNATIIDVARQVIAFARGSTSTLGSTSQLAVISGVTSFATLLDDGALGLPRTEPLTFADAFKQVIAFKRASTANLGDTAQSASVFGRSSTVTLGDPFNLGIPRTSTATLTDAFGLAFPRTDTATLIDTRQLAAAFGRTSAATLGDSFGLGMPRTDTSVLGDLAQLARAISRSSTNTIDDPLQSAASFFRTSTTTLSQSAGLGIGQASSATIADSSGLGFPRTDAPALVSTAQSATGLGRTSEATGVDKSRLGIGLPRSSVGNLGDTGAVSRGIFKFESSFAVLGDTSQSGVGVFRTTTATLDESSVLQATLSRAVSSTASLGDFLGLGLPLTSSASLGDAKLLIRGVTRAESSAVTLDDGSQTVALFGRTSAANLTDISQAAVTFPRSSSAGLSSSAALSEGVTPTFSSAATLGVLFQLGLGFPRTSSATLTDTFAITQVLKRTPASSATLGDAVQAARGLPRTSSPTLTDLFALKQGSSRSFSSTATLGGSSQGASIFGRSSTAALGDDSLLIQALSRTLTSAATLGDFSSLVRVLFRPVVSTTTLGDISQTAFAFFRSSAATLGDDSSVSLGLSEAGTSSATFGDGSLSASAFFRSSTAALGDTSLLTQSLNRGVESSATVTDAPQLASFFPRTTAATLGDLGSLLRSMFRTETSAVSLTDVSQSATSFFRRSAATLGDTRSVSLGLSEAGTSSANLVDTSQSVTAMIRKSAVTLESTSSLFKNLSRSPVSAVTLSDPSQSAVALIRKSAGTLTDLSSLSKGKTLPSTSSGTLVDKSLTAAVFGRASSASVGDFFQSALVLPRGSSASLGDTKSFIQGLNRPVASTSSLADLVQNAIAFPRTEAPTLTDPSQSAVAFLRSSSGTLSDASLVVQSLTRPVDSPATLTAVAQSAISFPRTEAVTLIETAQSIVMFPRSTSASLGDTAVFNKGLNRSAASTTSLADVARSAVTFPRTTATTLTAVAQSAVVFPRISSTSFTDAILINKGLNRPVDSSAGLTDVAQRAFGFSRSSTSSLLTVARSAVTFPRITVGTLSDSFLVTKGLNRQLTSSASFGDNFFLNQALNRSIVSSFALASTQQIAVTFPRHSAAGLADQVSFGFRPSLAALKESVVLTVQRNFVPPTPTPVPPATPTPVPPATQPPAAGVGGGVGGGGGTGGGAPISSVPSGSTLATDIVNGGSQAGAILSALARLDPALAGIQLAIAANLSVEAAAAALVVAGRIDAEATSRAVLVAALINPAVTAVLLVESGKISRDITGKIWAAAGGVNSNLSGMLVIRATNLDAEITGGILASAAKADEVKMGKALVHSARADALTTGEVLVVASEIDALSISKAILIAAKIDPAVIKASLESGSAGAAEALAALGIGVPVDSFLSENTPILGTDPSTGEVWEMVAPPSASVTILAKFSRGKPEAQVNVIVLTELPTGIARLPEGEIPGTFFRIENENFAQQDLRATHVTFAVAKSWLLENNIHPWAVSFNRYDEENDSWLAFNAKRIREDENFVYYTATPPGFSLWAVSGRTNVGEAGFRVDNLTINPPEVREFQEITVEAQVVNLGDSMINHNATLWLNGRVQATKSVEVPPNSVMPVSFKVFPREGAYEVRIDRQIGNLIVGQAPPPPSNSTVLVLGNASTTRTVTVANPAEGAPLVYVITTDQPWLTANPFTFSLRPGTFQPVTLTINRNGLQPGSYNGQAVISFTGLISGFSLVTVSMDVSESGVDPVVSPTLNLGPGGISGTTIVSNPLSESALLYTVTSHVPWLRVTNPSFVLAAGASEAIILTADRGALDIGFHTGLVTISYSGAISGSSVVAVELEVPPPPPPPLIPPVVNARLDLGATGTGGIITVSTPPSGGPLEYTVTSNAPWLTASPSSFVLSPGESRPVTLSVDRSGLEFGRYAAEITIAFDGSTSGSSLVPVTIEMAGAAFPREGRGLDTWALVLIGVGGAALLWIIVSQATLRLSGAGGGPVRPRGATPLGTGAQLDFDLEPPAQLQTAGGAVDSLQTGVTSALGKVLSAIGSGAGQAAKASLIGLSGVLRLYHEIGLKARNTGRTLFSRTQIAMERPAAPLADLPDEEPAPRPVSAGLSREPDLRAKSRVPYSDNGMFSGLGSRIQAIWASVPRLLAWALAAVRPGAKASTEVSGTLGAGTGRVAQKIGNRLDVGVLAYLISLPLLGAMALLLMLNAVGVGTGLGLWQIIITAIVASIVFISTRIRKTRSGNIRRAESTADFLDEDRA